MYAAIVSIVVYASLLMYCLTTPAPCLNVRTVTLKRKTLKSAPCVIRIAKLALNSKNALTAMMIMSMLEEEYAKKLQNSVYYTI